MAVENAYKASVSLKLNAGVKAGSAGMIIKSCSLGNVIHGADKDKIMNVVGTLLPILEHPLFRVERTEVTVLEN
jgi:hypothetical protein